MTDTKPERADLIDRCPKCRRYHSIDIAIGELCQRIEDAETLLRLAALGPVEQAKIQSYFDRWRNVA